MIGAQSHGQIHIDVYAIYAHCGMVYAYANIWLPTHGIIACVTFGKCFQGEIHDATHPILFYLLFYFVQYLLALSLIYFIAPNRIIRRAFGWLLAPLKIDGFALSYEQANVWILLLSAMAVIKPK